MTFGMVALGAAGALYSAALAILRRHDVEAPVWWFGYARDAVNMSAFLNFSVGFALVGLPGHLALLGGAIVTLSAYGADYLLARGLALPHAAWIHGVTLAALSAGAGLAARPIERGLTAILQRLF